MSGIAETIQSYDEHAADWANRMRSKKNLAHEYLEKPAMYGQLGDLGGLAVLCVGCGSGEECGHIKNLGAARVVGIDASKGLVEQAKYAYPEAEFLTGSIESAILPDESFDLAYSSLVMHYLPDWRPALRNIARMLKPGGRFLFSTHHPARFGAGESADKDSRLLGYVRRTDQDYQIHGDYFTPRPIRDFWFNKMRVNYYHKPLADMFREIKAGGFSVEDFLEPRPAAASRGVKPDFYEINSKIPLFAIFDLKKIT